MNNYELINDLQDKYKEGYLQIINKTQVNPWASHQYVLVHILHTVLNGNVFEFGMGYHSTVLLNHITKKQNRKLYSVDSDIEWLNKFLYLSNKNHIIEEFNINNLMPTYDKVLELNCSIAFIDCKPGELRQVMINLLKDKIPYIIVHDTEEIVYKSLRNGYGYDFSGFKFIYHFKGASATTTLLSNMLLDNNAISIF